MILLILLFAILYSVMMVATSRLLFRRWLRNDTFIVNDDACKCGYHVIHKQQECHGKTKLRNTPTALVAVASSVVFPVVLVFLFIMHNAPKSQREIEQHNKEMEIEMGIG
jgi:hypothetical protein